MKHTADAIELTDSLPNFLSQLVLEVTNGHKTGLFSRRKYPKPSGINCEGLKKLDVDCETKEVKNY